MLEPDEAVSIVQDTTPDPGRAAAGTHAWNRAGLLNWGGERPAIWQCCHSTKALTLKGQLKLDMMIIL